MRRVVSAVDLQEHKRIAEAIADGLRHGDEAEVEVLVDRVAARGLEGVDLLVVGGPTPCTGRAR